MTQFTLRLKMTGEVEKLEHDARKIVYICSKALEIEI